MPTPSDAATFDSTLRSDLSSGYEQALKFLVDKIASDPTLRDYTVLASQTAGDILDELTGKAQEIKSSLTERAINLLKKDPALFAGVVKTANALSGAHDDLSGIDPIISQKFINTANTVSNDPLFKQSVSEIKTNILPALRNGVDKVSNSDLFDLDTIKKELSALFSKDSNSSTTKKKKSSRANLPKEPIIQLLEELASGASSASEFLRDKIVPSSFGDAIKSTIANAIVPGGAVIAKTVGPVLNDQIDSLASVIAQNPTARNIILGLNKTIDDVEGSLKEKEKQKTDSKLSSVLKKFDKLKAQSKQGTPIFVAEGDTIIGPDRKRREPAPKRTPKPRPKTTEEIKAKAELTKSLAEAIKNISLISVNAKPESPEKQTLGALMQILLKEALT